MAKKKITLFAGKKKLATLWMIFSSILFTILLVQSFGDNFGDDVDEAWGWLFQNILPSLSLIVSVLVIDSKNKTKSRKVDLFYFRLSKYLSIAYLTTILITVLAEPFATDIADVSPLQFLKKSSLWLAPFQGIVTSALGIFFIKKSDSDDEESTSDKQEVDGN